MTLAYTSAKRVLFTRHNKAPIRIWQRDPLTNRYTTRPYSARWQFPPIG